MSRTEQEHSRKASRGSRATEIASTFEWLITAFLLALVFRAFVMEAFIIPTGSMADTLKGAHFRLACPQCGYEYDRGFDYRQGGRLHSSIQPPRTRCPNCGYYYITDRAIPLASGDRILVLKCIYQFFEPRRWDVIVFKNPLDPTINYIKRLVGLPGETVEIIDGDVYINGQIVRKPPKVQKELWMPIYDNDYHPARPREGSFNGRIWRQPFRNIEGSRWRLDENTPTRFRLDVPVNQINWLIYDDSVGNDFRSVYAYNDIGGYGHSPHCSDLKMRFYVCSAEPQGRIGISLSKYQNSYKAWVDFTGEMVISKVSQGKETVLVRKSIEPLVLDSSVLVKFANVDHRLVFKFGTEELIFDLGRGPNDTGPGRTVQPQVKIFGSGKLTLSHAAIFRDIHYTSAKFANGPKSGRVVEGRPFKLGKDEFFVLGDNSPNSQDGRWWDKPGVGNNGLFYREGIVPRDYLVGKALFVYWPSGFKPFAKFPFSIIPNVGQMHFIYGGSGKVSEL